MTLIGMVDLEVRVLKMTIKDIIDYIKVKHIYNTDCYNKDCMEKDKKYMVMKQEGLVCQDCKFAHGFVTVTNQAGFLVELKIDARKNGAIIMNNDVIELADARTKVQVLNCIKYIRQWLEIDVEVYDYDAGCLEFADSLRKLENYIAN